MLISSTIQIGPKFINDTFDTDVIKNEPMFFNSGLAYAYEQGGPITRAFIDTFLDDHPGDGNKYMCDDFVFDSRVHMLMKGWFPCIPGFHHDDVPRNTASGQPDYLTPSYRSSHVMGMVNGDICPTEFAVGDIDLKIPDGVIYKQWHMDVERAIADQKLKSVSAPSDHLVYFSDRSFHQGTRAVRDGWRWFGRISWNTDRVKHMSNEIRRQVQVYLEAPMVGW